MRASSPPVDFDRDRYLGGSLGRFTGETLHDVRILLDATAAFYARERPWHPSQKIAERPAGAIELTLRLNNLVDVENKVLRCGPHAEVLAPPELRARLRAAAAATLARYDADKR